MIKNICIILVPLLFSSLLFSGKAPHPVAIALLGYLRALHCQIPSNAYFQNGPDIENVRKFCGFAIVELEGFAIKRSYLTKYENERLDMWSRFTENYINPYNHLYAPWEARR